MTTNSNLLKTLEAFTQGGKTASPAELEAALQFCLSGQWHQSETLCKPMLLCLCELVKMEYDLARVLGCGLQGTATLDALSRFPKIQVALLKMLVKLVFYAANGEETVVLAACSVLLVFMRRFAAGNKLRMGQVLKLSYHAFLRGCHRVNQYTIGSLSMGTRAILEVLQTALSLNVTLATAFCLKAMRALAGCVRDALRHAKPTSIRDLHSWRFIGQVRLFSLLLTTSSNNEILAEMREPFLRLISTPLTHLKVSLGTLPFTFHLLESLAMFPEQLVPEAYAALFLALSALAQASAKPDSNNSKAPVYFFPALITVSDAECSSRSYQDAVADELAFLWTRLLASLSRSAAFPDWFDCLEPLFQQLVGKKGSPYGTKNPRLRQHISILIEKGRKTTDSIRKQRFGSAPMDYNNTISVKDGQTEMEAFLAATMRMRQNKAQMLAESLQDTKKETENKKVTEKTKIAKTTTKKQKTRSEDPREELETFVLSDSD